MQKIAIAGWFGSENFGDELLLHALASTIHGGCPGVEIAVLAADAERVRARHGHEAVGLPTLRDGGMRRARAVLRVLAASDLLIIGPGTVFQERSDVLSWPGTIPMLTRLVSMARLTRTPVAIVGAGVREGGTRAGRLALRAIGAMARDVAVRDERSAAEFGRNAQVIGDVALALDATGGDTAPPENRFLVSMRPLAHDRESTLGSTLRKLVETLAADGLNGCFLPMALGRGAAGENDMDVYARYLADCMPFTTSHFEERPFAALAADWLRLLRRQRLVLATRLHAALPAALCGVPTVAFAYERKVAETFRQLGLGRYVLDVTVDARRALEVCEAALSAEGRRDFAAAGRLAADQGASIRRLITSLTA